tara:strand:+ start:722 stop:1459 length:738 start_codon:yes stop_codon:yes gene_type:complete
MFNIFIMRTMSEQFLLSDLIDLQDIDNEIYKIESEKKSSEDVTLLKDLEIKFNDINKNVEEIKVQLSDYYSEIESYELDKKNIIQKVQNIDEKLGGDTLEPNELLNYTRQKESNQQQLIKIDKNIELLQVDNKEELDEINKFNDSLEELKKDLIETSKKVQNEWKELDIKLAELESKKKEMILNFPDEIQALYDDLKNKGVDVIAAYKLENNQCGCCGVDLTSSELDKIMDSKFQQCHYCDGVVV